MSRPKANERIDFFCFNLAVLDRKSLFIALTLITLAFFLLYGYLLELVFRLPGFEEFSWFFTLIQFSLYSVLAMGESVLRNDLQRKIPFKNYLLLGFLTVATMGLSNASVPFLNYPTQVMFKCCKLIPVLIGGIIIQNKRFNIYDVSASIAMSMGLIFFTLADVKVHPNFNLYGVLLISGALCADAAIGNVQEKQMKGYNASNIEVVLYSYSIGFVYILFGQIFFGNIIGAVKFWFQYPIQTFGYTLILSLSGYAGINIVLHLVKQFGALLAVTITTCRKAVTIVLSFIFFTKPFTYHMFDETKVKCLFFDLTRCSKSSQFITLSLTVFAFHLVQGYMHELIFRLPGFKPYSMFLTLLQFGIYAIFALLESLLKHKFRLKRAIKPNVSLKTYALIAFLSMCTMGLSNTAVAFLNFPTFNMFKSCKLIPVMVGSMIILGKKYNLYDKLAVLLMTLGLVFFTLADSKLHPNFELYGVIIVMGALIADAIIGNVQEKAMNENDSSNTEMVLYSYSIGFFYILFWEIFVSFRLLDAIKFSNENPKKTYLYILIYSAVGYFGVNVVLTLVKRFGALIAVTVTTCRKAITIVLSFILFAKPFSMQ
ncbi:adenosine 3 -phospho 5 -phosphosulfate transporter 2 isoform X2 [Brachionus plicatilis]|uniref:Adenosine 3'-phospho 5'-phosphosulfate transporter 2 n=1 Tax=Brachionus plicatilis TaxID=10195 RepID=A0A3M7P5I6_BRAPC|nr:adenosine 3 -phospho 5 -phosphosulfate transporter 2 isoform X2 [Brachionus plicatilis]